MEGFQTFLNLRKYVEIFFLTRQWVFLEETYEGKTVQINHNNSDQWHDNPLGNR